MLFDHSIPLFLCLGYVLVVFFDMLGSSDAIMYVTAIVNPIINQVVTSPPSWQPEAALQSMHQIE